MMVLMIMIIDSIIIRVDASRRGLIKIILVLILIDSIIIDHNSNGDDPPKEDYTV